MKWEWQIIDKNGDLWTSQKFRYDNAKFLTWHLNYDRQYKEGKPWKMQKTDDCWAREPLEGGKQKITVPLSNVNMLTLTDQLLVKTRFVFNQFDVIEIEGIKAVITGGELPEKFPAYNWLLTVECEQMEELKELLTYKIGSTATPLR